MKIGPATSPPRLPDPLPLEVMSQILAYAVLDRDEWDQQRTLWSCCLISKGWYSASISQLYESPLLTSRSFEAFARIICPPVNSHVRTIGLESLVKRLDMGTLAYASTNSLTARLLRRTGPSLEVFVAPAKSFSINSVVALGKCYNLHSLDISRHWGITHLTFRGLLHAIRNLPKLTKLGIPAQILSRGPDADDIPWPPNLEVLHLDGWLESGRSGWEVIARLWPRSLTTLSLGVGICELFPWGLLSAEAEVPSITSLRVSAADESFAAAKRAMLSLFPCLRFLSVSLEWGYQFEKFLDLEVWRSLEILELKQRPFGHPSINGLLRNPFFKNLDYLPQLWQLRVPGSIFDSVRDEQVVHAAHKLLKGRAIEKNQVVGSGAIPLEEAGIQRLSNRLESFDLCGRAGRRGTVLDGIET